MADRRITTLVETLAEAGMTCAFGLPGTQNTDLFEALRGSPLTTVVPCHELAAAMMATGYFRASGRPALLATIPGPGFTYALTGVAEAFLDSAALVQVTRSPARGPGRAYQLQAIHQAAMARPVVKDVLEIGPADDVRACARAAVAAATSGEPGPVLVQLAKSADSADSAVKSGSAAARTPATATGVDRLADWLAERTRILVLVGQGAAGVADQTTRLVEALGAVAISTTSGRGTVPEDHPRSLGHEFGGTEAGPLNDLVAASDGVLALGCKFSHNASRGFALRIPPEKLAHVDASAEVIGANYPASEEIVGRCEEIVPGLLRQATVRDGWSEAELARWRARGHAGTWNEELEPVLCDGRTCKEMIRGLREALPREAIVVTDSGRHQNLVRRWFRVLAPRGLIVPTNFQSMGFAIPAAIGARLAAPKRPVVAVVGDGGFMMSGLELMTARKHGVDLTVVVLNDGAYGMIKRGQLAAHGAAPGSDLLVPDLERFAAAADIHYVRLGRGDLGTQFVEALALPGVTLLEVPAREQAAMKVIRAKGRLKRWLRPFRRDGC